MILMDTTLYPYAPPHEVSSLLSKVIRVPLSQNMDTILPRIMDEVKASFNDILGEDVANGAFRTLRLLVPSVDLNGFLL